MIRIGRHGYERNDDGVLFRYEFGDNGIPQFIDHANKHELRLVVEIERLQAIVKKLPKTADGVQISFGDELYCIDSQTQWTGYFTVRGAILEHVDRNEEWLIITDCDHERWSTDCYSTREAAEKARDA